MDARRGVPGLRGLRPGDAHGIRNAGGRATADAIRALAISQAVLGTREVMVIHHTDCAVGRFSQHELVERIERATGQALNEDFGTFTDPIEAGYEEGGSPPPLPPPPHPQKKHRLKYRLP